MRLRPACHTSRSDTVYRRVNAYLPPGATAGRTATRAAAVAGRLRRSGFRLRSIPWDPLVGTSNYGTRLRWLFHVGPQPPEHPTAEERDGHGKCQSL
jgi:hypothetical protein